MNLVTLLNQARMAAGFTVEFLDLWMVFQKVLDLVVHRAAILGG